MHLVDTRKIKEAPDLLGCEQRKMAYEKNIQVV